MNQTTSQLFSASVFPRPLHAAALALAGWFLIIPPPRLVGTMEAFQTHFDAPQSKWVRMRRFNHRDKCEKTLAEYRQHPPKDYVDLLGGEDQARATMNAGRCIEAKDSTID
jgi:hypothetical protein